ncbi:Protein kinase of the Mitotic Exit Network, variant 3 [Entomophthora muscae]|nr:Protein kinase of the Mitotic Exit Network, variant 3 [Entomophthora muscae]
MGRVSLNEYQLGDCIGKGAFGTVYRGLNMETGEAVAVKQLLLVNINKISVDVMMMEIDLLKKLNHQNIVKYMGFIKTSYHMNIIIEYCENGSLQSIYKRFGKFPENLTGVYIAQVLDGLLYLHEQGVIHRDIKGANILSTKEGLVKLADFGVATHANEDHAVVGSPYWMAPEVIELNGATTTSDIWSVGCTVIELMEGNPPYYQLAPMPALFRIVQDDHPPLPQGVSPSVCDFLLQCFQKDCNLRVSAKKLLKHPWIQNARLKGNGRKEAPKANFDEDLRKVQEWNEALKRNLSPDNTIDNGKNMLSPNYMQHSTFKEEEDPIQSPVSGLMEMSPSSPTAPMKSRMLHISSFQPEEAEDNWDNDFDISGTNININKIKKDGPENNHYRRPAPPRSNSKESSFEKAYLDDDYLIENLSHLENNEMILRRDGYISPPAIEHKFAISENPLTRYAEDGLEDYSDVFGTAIITNTKNAYAHELFRCKSNSPCPSTKTATSYRVPNDEDDEEDPFQSLEEGLEQTDLQANIIRDKHARITAEIKQHIRLLSPDQDELTLLETCKKLDALLLDNPHMKYKFISYHGVLPILEMLEVSEYEPVLLYLLKIINSIVHSNVEIQENLCLVGGIPVIISLASKRYPLNIRLEVAYFIRQLCHTSTFTLQMFISCRGLKILVDFIEEDYDLEKDLVWIAINGIASIFELQTPTPKHDFCRLFAKSGLLEPLSSTFLRTVADKDHSADRYTAKIVHLFLIFSQADSYVKEMMGTSVNIVGRLLREIMDLPMDLSIIVLKCIRNLSMNPNTLETLERAEAIEILTRFLTSKNAIGATEICNQVLNTLYNLCRINKHRQELAARAGIIPHLQHIVTINSPLKQYALPVLCDMAHAGKVCRRLLWKNNGLQFYLGLLRDPNWQTNGLEAILIW